MHGQHWKLMNADTIHKKTADYIEMDVWRNDISPGSVSHGFSWINAKGEYCLYNGYNYNNIWCYKKGAWNWKWGDAERLYPKRKWKEYRTYSEENNPGNRRNVSFCQDGKGGIYLYGGRVRDWSTEDRMSDLWHWNGENWACIWGGIEINEPIKRGKKGQYDSLVTPGFRDFTNLWCDNNGNTWLYGGSRSVYDSTLGRYDTKYLSDLWCFNGNNWAWMGGDTTYNFMGYWEVQGKFHINNRPPSLVSSKLAKDTSGLVYFYGGGYGPKYQFQQNSAWRRISNMLWCFNGQEWACLTGDTTFKRKKPNYSTLNVYDSANTPGSKSSFTFFFDSENRLNLYAGNLIDTFYDGRLNGSNTFWQWSENGWACLFDKTPSRPKFNGDNANPGSRAGAATWLDHRGDLLMFGGSSYFYPPDTYIFQDGQIYIDSFGEYADMWRLLLTDPYHDFNLHYQGHNLKNSSIAVAGATHFGSRAVTDPVIWRKFHLLNIGNWKTTVKPEDLKWIANDGSFFFDFKESLIHSDDSTELLIGFKPKKEGKTTAQLLIEADGSTFLINLVGIGTSAEISVIQSESCASARLYIGKEAASFYTVLVKNEANATYGNWLVDGQNYGYSPNYLLAPEIANDVKILYQGTDRLVSITNLVSNRDYTFWVVPGTGAAGRTEYFADSLSEISYSIQPSYSQALSAINPNIDTGYCKGMVSAIEAKAPFNIKWNDDQTTKSRLPNLESNHYFTFIDDSACLVSSDTVFISSFPEAEKPTITQLNANPLCEGDTAELSLSNSKDNVYWVSDSSQSNVLVTKDGWHSAYSMNAYGCVARDSLRPKFLANPIISVDETDFVAVNGKLKIDAQIDHDSFFWIYLGDTFNGSFQIDFKDTNTIELHAFNKGCRTVWQGIVFNAEPHFETPNAFTPNGDNLNDEFYPETEVDANKTLIIFDRWGGIIYSGNAPWNGTKNGEPVPLGKYQYCLKSVGGEDVWGVVTLLK
ncbi:MAG: gliding motility-associated C-terminal domain-containing protein [Bacteroidetes bacterium]|nr:gliding motility-associated C-terminal domain-containing protein [Bacteroidota bacterium]